jgi:beta-aspartyl-peptidase (threonine type)
MVGSVIVVHGGAWSIPDDQVEENIAGVEEAARKGWNLLIEGGSALDAVNVAVNSMEDDPIFDAGIGSVLTEEGTVEMDALIMDGSNLHAGAVAGLRDVRYPVNLARVVMEETPHVLMMGEGANRLALEHGLERITQEKLVTDYARWELREWLKERRYSETFSHETVGAVALDQRGNLAAATSTGGVTGKLVGRVGDVPIVGSGGYADNRIGAVSSTGDGESILRVNLARLVLTYLESGIKVEEATEKALGYMKERVNGRGGLIAVDTRGNFAHPFTTKRMAWAAIKEETLTSGINP